MTTYLGHEFDGGKCSLCGAVERSVRQFRVSCKKTEPASMSDAAPQVVVASADRPVNTRSGSRETAMVPETTRKTPLGGFRVKSVGMFGDAPVGKLNKLVRVSLKGGLLGLAASDPHRTLSEVIAKENEDGWKVVQVIPDDTGNLVTMVLRFIILMITFLLFTTANGYWLVMEKVDSTN